MAHDVARRALSVWLPSNGASPRPSVGHARVPFAVRKLAVHPASSSHKISEWLLRRRLLRRRFGRWFMGDTF